MPTIFEFPVPHIYEDGSVAQLTVNIRDVERAGCFISIANDRDSIVVADADHARRLAPDIPEGAI